MNLQPQDFNVGYREATNIVLLYSLAEKHHSSFKNLLLLIQLRRWPELEHFDPGLWARTLRQARLSRFRFDGMQFHLLLGSFILLFCWNFKWESKKETISLNYVGDQD